MKRLATTLFLAVALACTALAPAAQAQQLLFDYVGFDYENPDLAPSTFGALGDGYRGVGFVPVLFAPLVSDQANNEYTYYFDGLVAVNRQVIGSFAVIDYAGPGTLTIYQDPKASGTPADYGTNPPSAVSPVTFTDGTPVLVGSLTNFRYILNLNTGSGSFEAVFTVTGGTQFGNFPANQLLGWTFAGTTQNTLSVPEGYDHQVDGQTFLNEPVPARSDTWGGLKRRYR
jgi:hypothetical protein